MIRQRTRLVTIVATVLFAAFLLLYSRTMAPGTLFDLGDPGDLQMAVAGLGVPHPTGYPLFVLVGWLWVHILAAGTMGWRLNLLVAIFGALAVALTALLAYRVTRRILPSAAAGLLFGLSYTFWTQTSISEVYTLNAVFVAAVLLLLLAWGERPEERRTLVWAAFVYGLSLAHHRTMILLLPAIAAYVWLADRRVYADWRLLMRLAAATLPGLALYALVFWRLMSQGTSPAAVLWGTVLGGSFVGSLGQAPDWQNIFWTLPTAQFGPLGVAAAALGVAVLLARRASRAAGVLLLLTWAGVSLFCLIYRIPEIDPFLIPAFLAMSVAASGLSFLTERLEHGPRLALEGAAAVLVLFLMWPAGNLARVPQYWAEETGASEREARAVLASPLEPGAAVEAAWNTAAALRYLQAAEGSRSDLEVLPVKLASQAEYQRLGEMLAAGRPVYLLKGVQVSRISGAAALWEPLREPAGATRLSVAPFTMHDNSVLESIGLRGFRMDEAGFTLFWQVRAPVPGDYHATLDYFDFAGVMVAQDDKDPGREAVWGFATSRWQPGSLVADLYRPAPASAAFVRVSLLDGAGRGGKPVGRAATIQLRPAAIPAAATTVGAPFGREITLAACQVAATAPQAMTLTLYWRPQAAPSRDYTVFVHALDENRRIIGQGDRPPLNGLYPTSDWRPGDLIREEYVVPVQRKPMVMLVGLYDRTTMQRLLLPTGEDSVMISVEPVP